jgi:hypothetical protein
MTHDSNYQNHRATAKPEIRDQKSEVSIKPEDTGQQKPKYPQITQITLIQNSKNNPDNL